MAEQKQADRRLNAEVALKIMGWTFTPYSRKANQISGWKDTKGQPQNLPFYSTDIAEAWKVVEKMRGDGISVDAIWRAWLKEFLGIDFIALTASEAAHQICLAALKAKGEIK